MEADDELGRKARLPGELHAADAGPLAGRDHKADVHLLDLLLEVKLGLDVGAVMV